MTNTFGTEHEPTRTTRYLNGVHYEFAFANGYVASVIRNDASYGNRNGEGLWEMAALKDGKVVTTPVTTGDIASHLSELDVARHLRAIEALPKAGA